MRESIGGAWLISFVVLFIVLFTSFLAVMINYTKAFKVKNQIINLIEEHEGFTKSDLIEDSFAGTSLDELKSKNTTQTDAYLLLKSQAYNFENIKNCSVDQGEYQVGGYCVKKICVGLGQNTRAKYYKVTTFINFEIPIISININIPISGETNTLYYVNSSDDLECANYEEAK